MKKLQLEMGGKNPLVVLDDADVEHAAMIGDTKRAFREAFDRCVALFDGELKLERPLREGRDVLLLTLRMRGGAYAVIDIARKSPAGADRRLEIFGEKQILQVANNRADLLTALDGSGTQTAAPTDGLVRFAASWQREMQAFVDCIAHDTVPAVGAEDGLRSIRAAQALNLALRERRVVRLDELG